MDSNFDWFSSYYQLRQEQEKRYFEFDVIDPTFAQPGVNLYSTNHIAGVMWDFQRNKWLRRNIEPDERIAQTYFKFDLTKQKYRDYIKGAHEFKPVENTHLKCKSRIEIDKNTKNETVVLSSDEYICLKILKSGEYVFRSDRYRQNIGILTSTNRCSSNDLKKNEYVPFYFHKGNYVLCSMKLYSGIVSHLDNEIE